MKTKRLFSIAILFVALNVSGSYGQANTTNHLGALGQYCGWDNFTSIPFELRHNNLGANHTIDVYTGGYRKAQFTNAWNLGNTYPTKTLILGVGAGDGLKITPRSMASGCSYNNTSTIDLWTSCSDGTNIKWGNNGQISGATSRFELWSNLNGFYFNAGRATSGYIPRYSFNTEDLSGSYIEHGRISHDNMFWRIGQSGNDATRQLEVVDDVTQFRITNTAPSPGTYARTEFKTGTGGTLEIDASSSVNYQTVFINNSATSPFANLSLDVNGQERLRTVNSDNTLTEVLVWDPASQIIKKRNMSTVGVGNVCGGTLNAIPSPGWQIPVNANNYYFSNNTGTLGSVIIGNITGCPTSTARLEIFNTDAKGQAGLFTNAQAGSSTIVTGTQMNASNTGTGGTMGITSLSLSTGTSGDATGMNTTASSTGSGNARGVQSLAIVSGTGNAIGVNGVSQSAGYNSIGVQGISNGGAMDPTATAIGVNGRSNNTTNPSSIVIGVNAVANSGVTHSYGANIDVIGSSSPQNYGIQTEILSGTNAGSNNWGHDLRVSTPGNNNLGSNYLVSGGSVRNVGSDMNISGASSVENIGLKVTVGASGTADYGVYSSVPSSYLGGLGPNWAGYFLGDVFGSGVYLNMSDRSLKKDIKPIENSLELVNKLNPVNYYFDREKNPNLGLPAVNQWGFISQEVQEILPEFTKKTLLPAQFDEKGNQIAAEQEALSLNYNGFIAILTSAIQEQQKQIDDQQKVNDEQQKQIDELKEMIGMMQQTNDVVNPNTHHQDVELLDNEYVVLNQNVPNPFAEQTTITYVIPQNAMDVQIIFYNALGQMIKSLPINDRGEGRLNVFADDLSSGIYSYSLIMDGKVIDTKKMIKK